MPDNDGASDERPAGDQKSEPDELAAELIRRVRRTESRRLARIYTDILSEGAQKKSREEEEREWQAAVQPADLGEPGWGAELKRGTLFALAVLLLPLGFVVTSEWLFPHALSLKPEGIAALMAALIILGCPAAFLIGMLTTKKRSPDSTDRAR
ncbi:MAG TPA: hypothetical protein VFG04_04195 [Planctomycetaceae bacterium]|jgi:hypothetical protein|nr:hypothetical protein [Planctomycetaceae bacterium]